MTREIQGLSNSAAVKAASIVAKSWLEERGFQAHVCLEEARRKVGQPYDEALNWGLDEGTPNDDSGALARYSLSVLSDSEDEEVKDWVAAALKRVREFRAYALDPASMLIGGGILICTILAARVKRIGTVEFYEGIPKPTPDLLKLVAKAASAAEIP